MKKIILILICSMACFICRATSINILNQCYTEVDTGGGLPQYVVTVTYDGGAGGNDIYLWNTGLLGLTGPYTPLTKSLINGSWVYTYIVTFTGVTSCFQIYPGLDPSVTPSGSDPNYTVCKCGIDVIETCRVKRGNGTQNQPLTVTYGPSAAGADIYLWYTGVIPGLLGPIAPISKTFINGYWIYTYNVPFMLNNCFDIYPGYDAGTTPAGNDPHYEVCPCSIDVTGTCRVKTGDGMSNQSFTVSFGPNAAGSDIYLWYTGVISGLLGPISPVSKTFVNGNWIYEYQIPLMLNTCFEIYPNLDANTTPTASDPHYEVCPCDINVLYGCYKKIDQTNKTVTLIFDANIAGVDVYVWKYSLLGFTGPYSPTSKTFINGVWQYTYNVGATGISPCFDLYYSLTTVTPSTSDPKTTVCATCGCDATFTYCAGSDNPYKLTFTPNTQDPFPSVSYDFGDGSGCTNCSLPITHTYNTEGTFKVCQSTIYPSGERCTQCTEICIEKNEVGGGHSDPPGGGQ